MSRGNPSGRHLRDLTSESAHLRPVDVDMHVIATSTPHGMCRTGIINITATPNNSTNRELLLHTTNRSKKTQAMDGKGQQIAFAATSQALKVDEGAPGRESKRTRLIQSEVEAAAARDAQDYYIARLTENYKQKLDMSEQGYKVLKQEIQELKSQLTASAEKTRQDQEAKQTALETAQNYKQKSDALEQCCQVQARRIEALESQLYATAEKEKEDQKARKTVAEAAELVKTVKIELDETKGQLAESRNSAKIGLEETQRQLTASQKSTAAIENALKEARSQLAESQKSVISTKVEIEETEWQLAESRKSCAITSDQALKAEWNNHHLKRRHKSQLEEALADNDKFMEIGFRKQWATKLSSAPSFAVKRRSATFLELAKMGLKSTTLCGRTFEYKGRTVPITDFGKTLTEVSGIPLTRRHGGQLG